VSGLAAHGFVARDGSVGDWDDMSDQPKSLPLVFNEPRGRKKPPRHLADLDEPGRKALLEEMGLPGFRAKQLSMHYFGRLVDDLCRELRPHARTVVAGLGIPDGWLTTELRSAR
jgi:hypothetical protein